MRTGYFRICFIFLLLLMSLLSTPLFAKPIEDIRKEALSIRGSISPESARLDLLELLNYYDSLRVSVLLRAEDLTEVLWTLDKIEALYSGNGCKAVFCAESLDSFRKRIENRLDVIAARQASASLDSIYETVRNEKTDKVERAIRKTLKRDEIKEVLKRNDIELSHVPCSICLAEPDLNEESIDEAVIVSDSQDWEEIIIEGTADFMMDRAQKTIMISFFSRIYDKDIKGANVLKGNFKATGNYLKSLERGESGTLRELPDTKMMSEFMRSDIRQFLEMMLTEYLVSKTESSNAEKVRDIMQLMGILGDYLEGKSISSAILGRSTNINDQALKQWLCMLSYLYEVDIESIPTENRCDALSLVVLKYAEMTDIEALINTEKFFAPDSLLKLYHLMTQVAETTQKINAEIKSGKAGLDRICELTFDLSSDFLNLITYCNGINVFENDSTSISDDLKNIMKYASELSRFATCLRNKDYQNSIRQLVVILEIMSDGGDVSIDINLLNTDFQRTIEILSAFASVKDANDVREVYEKYALPETSYLAKRNARTDDKKIFGCYINSYVGLMGGWEKATYESEKIESKYATCGLMMPIGLEFTFQPANKVNLGMLISVLDLGTYSQMSFFESRGDVSTQDWKFSSVFAPGAFIIYALPNTAITFGFGGQMLPNFRKVNNRTDIDAYRACVFGAIDIPMFRLY